MIIANKKRFMPRNQNSILFISHLLAVIALTVASRGQLGQT